MKNEKYIFNAQTLKYERAVVSWGKRLLNVFMFVCASVVFSLIISSVVYNFFDSPKEKILKSELSGLKEQYALLDKETARLNAVLDGLQYRDGNIYRVLFESDPIPSSVWEAGSGGVNKYKHLEKYDNGELMIDVSQKVDKLKRQMAIQSKSYDEIATLIKGKEQMLASIPSIQPVKNRDLERIASGFGYRIDPVYKVTKFHSGLDFTAPIGTEIFATGDGVVETVDFSYGGYGNEVVINHGYGYKTRYAHMSRTKARPGQKVTRGEVIGYVGNTGKSTGPHVHYEVLKSNEAINPIYFFYNDVTDAMFAKIVDRSQNAGQTLD
ncbi:MAG: Peptidase [Bacteroidetes bacterium]|nr:Peptidase [Bacteroidota bacterium]